MAELTRFGISMDDQLLEQFDRLLERRGHANRSEGIRDLVRNALVEDQWARGNHETIGTITLVYDHHVRDLSERLTQHQHDHHDAIVSALHVHLDHSHCLEVIVIRGRAKKVRKLADGLIGTKGVKHGRLVTTTTGKNLT